jgi:hypothetical protein
MKQITSAKKHHDFNPYAFLFTIGKGSSASTDGLFGLVWAAMAYFAFQDERS